MLVSHSSIFAVAENERKPIEDCITNRVDNAAFLDGMTFTWTMSGNALNAPTFSQVGTSSNSDGSMWDIYRDDDCTLRVADNGYVSAIEAYTVTSRFWCF